MPLPTVRYSATRSLVGGVTASTTITLTLPVRYAGMTRSRAAFKNKHRAISGRRETYYQTGENSWSIATKPLAEAQAAQIVMFLESVEDGQTFSFDPGTDGLGFRNAELDSDGYDEPRQPERDSLVMYQFSIVAVP